METLVAFAVSLARPWLCEAEGGGILLEAFDFLFPQFFFGFVPHGRIAGRAVSDPVPEDARPPRASPATAAIAL
jgi:hypothetical protein